MRSLGWLGALMLCTSTALGAQAPSALPAGAGAAVVTARCMGCHGTDLISSQRLSHAGWTREIDKMTRWGATVADTERTPLIDYLAAHYGPTPSVSHDTAALTAGETVYRRACLTCHGADLIDAQRLGVAGWTREVEKMMRWGAVVSDVEKPALVAFLASRRSR